MNKPHIGILHYSVPPVIGGVEAVIEAHLEEFIRRGYPVSVIAGRGDAEALPPEVDLQLLEKIDSQHPQVIEHNRKLERGRVPDGFWEFRDELRLQLAPILAGMDCLIVHNVFTKHFNLALTSALKQLIDSAEIKKTIAWSHDFTWTSSNSGHKVHPGDPWDILRTKLLGVKYVVVSKRRRDTLADLFGCSPQEIEVVYNGIDPSKLAGLAPDTLKLSERLNLFDGDLVILMPVRVTQAKNIEYAFAVVSELKAAGWNPKLVVTGPPDPHDETIMEYFHSLQDLRSELGVEREARFVFESGEEPGTPLTIELSTVGELYRLSDAILMPSHREGFGMPVLEAGFTGLPVFCTPFPAAVEIGGKNVHIFDADQDPKTTAGQMIDKLKSSHTFLLKQTVRKNYTWRALFENAILPLLKDPSTEKVA